MAAPSSSPSLGSGPAFSTLAAEPTALQEASLSDDPQSVGNNASINPSREQVPLSPPTGGISGANGNVPLSKKSAEAKVTEKTEDHSPSPTLTGGKNQSHPSKPSRNRVSDTSPMSNSTSKSNRHTDARQPKPSIISKIAQVLVPCLFSSPRFHPIDLEDNKLVVTAQEKTPVAQPTSPTTEAIPQKETSIPSIPITSESPSVADVAPQEEKQIPAEEPIPVVVNVPESPAPTIITSSGVQSPGSTGVPPKPSNTALDQLEDDSEVSSATDDDEIEDVVEEPDPEEEEKLLRGGTGIPIGPDGIPKPLLPPIAPEHVGRKCLILDLDETLVHSSFKSIQQADYVVPVEIEYQWHNVYVIKRPGVDNFLKKMGEIYEVVVFTASLSKYADPVLDKLDIHQVVTHRLFRESCYNHKGNYVKDLSQLGRPISDTIILDNSPASYIFHPNNAVPVSSWFNDPHDTELTDLVPFLADLGTVDDVRGVLDGAR